jgi:phenylpropionate dioxygenase-like ring-hydroxylating dioxygenase large terminal subunit
MAANNNELFLRNMWYLAMPSGMLKTGKTLPKEVLGEKLVFGRTSEGEVFALRDNCPHRGVPLSDGWFDGKEIQCCYHGWKFNSDGVCTEIPALAPESTINICKFKAIKYLCKEISGTIWVYIPQSKLGDLTNVVATPDLIIPETKHFKHVETVVLPCNIDHAVIGLIDPAHVTFVHQSWFWRSKKSLRIKEKHFEPTTLGFKMARHKPSSNSKGYKVLKGGTSTEIKFEIPGNRFEHILVGEKDEIVSITTLTPLNENETELNQFFYASLGIVNFIWWPLKKLGKTFIGQDLGVFRKLKKGLANNPKLLLVGDPDTQAQWYFHLKKQWHEAQENYTEFKHTLKPATLKWVT